MTRALYSLLIYLLLPVALLKLLWRAWRQPDYLRHIPERLGFYRLPRPRQPLPLPLLPLLRPRRLAQ